MFDAPIESSLIQQGRRSFSDWRQNPRQFTRQVLGEDCWSKQEEILGALLRRNMLAVRSGHKIGKSNLAAKIALFFAMLWKNVRVVLMAPSAHQIKNITWRELRRLYGNAPVDIGGRMSIDPMTGFHLSNGSSIFGIATDEPERMAGISGSFVVYLIDEASLINVAIYEACLGNIAGGGMIVMFGNPTRTSGPFFDAFTTNRDLFSTFAIPSTSTPNCTGEGPWIPGLATPQYVDSMRRMYGEGSLVYSVRVLGDFPQGASKAVIPLYMAEQAKNAWSEYAIFEELHGPQGQLQLGVDVGRERDRTVISGVRGWYAYPQHVVNKEVKRGADVAHEIIVQARSLAPGEKVRVAVDCGGIGASVIDALFFRNDPMLEVYQTNFGAGSHFPNEYKTMRDQIWYTLRDWLQGGGVIPCDDLLIQEILAPEVDDKSMYGCFKIEGKDKIKFRIGRSPDRGDALCLAVHRPREAELLYAS